MNRTERQLLKSIQGRLRGLREEISELDIDVAALLSAPSEAALSDLNATEAQRALGAG